MRFSRTLTLALTVASAAAFAWGSEPASDFPGASDLRNVTRPADSFIIGALHIDNDELAVPTGPVASNARKPAKAVNVTGPIDMLAYAGPKAASSLTVYTGLAGQLKIQGYSEVWSCARASCGSAFTLANILDQPLIDSIHEGSWTSWIINDLNAINDDIRYGAFSKGGEYILVIASHAPGYDSGALIIRANGPANDPVLQAAPPAEKSQEEKSASPVNGAVKEKARSILNRLPR